MTADYAGDLAPRDAWALLEREPRARLIDVRTAPEWSYVGLPDLGQLGKQALTVSWQVYPSTQPDPGFADQLRAAGVAPDDALLFLCRSGVRSLAAARLMAGLGFQRCYNVAGGFEGPHDGARHRGTVAGWKHDGLPWTQG